MKDLLRSSKAKKRSYEIAVLRELFVLKPPFAHSIDSCDCTSKIARQDMNNSKLVNELIQIQSEVQSTVISRWIHHHISNLHQIPSRILYDYDTSNSDTERDEINTSIYSIVVETVFQNQKITRIGIIFIVVGALLFFCLISICYKCYWYKYVKPYEEYKKVSTEYDELLSDVFAHDDLTDYGGSDDDGSIDSDDSLREIELGKLSFATKDVKLSLSEMNG